MRLRSVIPPLKTIAVCGALASIHTGLLAADTDARLDSPAAVLAMLHARITCSNRFISGIDADRTAKEDLRGYGTAETVVNTKQHSVTSRIGDASQVAVFSPGAGCTSIVGTTADALNVRNGRLSETLEKLPYRPNSLDDAEDMPGVDDDQLEAAVDAAFREQSGKGRKNTRAIVVLRHGKVIAERYAQGISADTALAGYSMAKSVLSIVIGTLVKKDLLDNVKQRVGLERWQGPGDRRADITYEDLMKMTAGLAWNEDYTDPMSDPLVSLFGSRDSSELAASRPIYMPEERYFNYSSGNAQILSLAIRKRLAREGLNSELYPYQEVFAPLGMETARLEVDAAGNPLYGGFMYASARDWARFGQFLLDNGRFGHGMLVPDDWLRYITTPSAVSDGLQGVLFALNAGEVPQWPSLPADTFGALGFRGQRLLVVPSRSLVIVRLGASVPEDAWNVDAFSAQVVGAVGGAQPATAELQ